MILPHTMVPGMLILLALVYITKGDVWEITVKIANVTSSTRNINLTFTIYERETPNVGVVASNITMAITTTSTEDTPTIANVGIPGITRPIKIDVWDIESEYIQFQFLELTMESSSYNFTFECNCKLDTEENKISVFATEDMWSMETTTGGGLFDGTLDNFGIIIWDNAGVSQEETFYSGFKKKEVKKIDMILHLGDPVEYTMWSIEKNDMWGCTKIVFIHKVTCRTFIFNCGAIKYFPISGNIFETGIRYDCFPATTTTATATISTTAIPSTTDTTTTVIPTTTTTIPGTATSTTITEYQTTTTTASTATATFTTATPSTTATITTATPSTTATITTATPSTTASTAPTPSTTATITTPTPSTTATITTPTPSITATITTPTPSTTATITIATPSTTATITTTTPSTTATITTATPSVTASVTTATPSITATITTATTTEETFTTVSTYTTEDQSSLPCCPCVHRKPAVNMTISQLEAVIEGLKTELTVKKTTLSSTTRKKTSATDNRTSSKAIGMVGALFMIVPFIFIVIFDLTRFCHHL